MFLAKTMVFAQVNNMIAKIYESYLLLWVSVTIFLYLVDCTLSNIVISRKTEISNRYIASQKKINLVQRELLRLGFMLLVVNGFYDPSWRNLATIILLIFYFFVVLNLLISFFKAIGK